MPTLVEQWIQQGRDDGLKKGKAEEKAEVALKMLKAGLPVEQVQKFTEVSDEELQKLIKQITH